MFMVKEAWKDGKTLSPGQGQKIFDAWLLDLEGSGWKQASSPTDRQGGLMYHLIRVDGKLSVDVLVDRG